MAVFAIGDLHLPGGDDKPMNVFGPHWDGHFERIQADWRSKVRPEDTVLIPGDISWAMQTKDALPDLLAALESLGYRRLDIIDMAQKLVAENMSADVATLVPMALKQISGNK